MYAVILAVVLLLATFTHLPSFCHVVKNWRRPSNVSLIYRNLLAGLNILQRNRMIMDRNRLENSFFKIKKRKSEKRKISTDKCQNERWQNIRPCDLLVADSLLMFVTIPLDIYWTLTRNDQAVCKLMKGNLFLVFFAACNLLIILAVDRWAECCWHLLRCAALLQLARILSKS